ncbi:hypothetical protein ASG11_05145 [Sphingomonas sp. Leaf357]|nr:hypothetical protein ASG11_05145 [Sphingomonas sp. Leaf357]
MRHIRLLSLLSVWLAVLERQNMCSRKQRGVSMDLYYFAVADRFAPQIADAVEFPTLASARVHALRFAAQILSDQLPPF